MPGRFALTLETPALAPPAGWEGPILDVISGVVLRQVNQAGSFTITVPMAAGDASAVKVGWRVTLRQERRGAVDSAGAAQPDVPLLYRGKVLRPTPIVDDAGATLLVLEGETFLGTLADAWIQANTVFTHQTLNAILSALLTPLGVTWEVPPRCLTDTLTIELSDMTVLAGLIKLAEATRTNLSDTFTALVRFTDEDLLPDPAINVCKDDPILRVVNLERSSLGTAAAAQAGFAVVGGTPAITFDGSELVNKLKVVGVDFDNSELTLEAAEGGNYTIHTGTGPVRNFFYIEDTASRDKYGSVESQLVRSDVKNPNDDPTSRAQAKRVLAAIATGEMLRRRSEIMTLQVDLLNGEDIYAVPGERAYVRYKGRVTRAGASTDVDLDLYCLIARRGDRVGEGGLRLVSLDLTTPELQYAVPTLPDATAVPTPRPNQLPPARDPGGGLVPIGPSNGGGGMIRGISGPGAGTGGSFGAVGQRQAAGGLQASSGAGPGVKGSFSAIGSPGAGAGNVAMRSAGMSTIGAAGGNRTLSATGGGDVGGSSGVIGRTSTGGGGNVGMRSPAGGAGVLGATGPGGGTGKSGSFSAIGSPGAGGGNAIMRSAGLGSLGGAQAAGGRTLAGIGTIGDSSASYGGGGIRAIGIPEGDASGGSASIGARAPAGGGVLGATSADAGVRGRGESAGTIGARAPSSGIKGSGAGASDGPDFGRGSLGGRQAGSDRTAPGAADRVGGPGGAPRPGGTWADDNRGARRPGGAWGKNMAEADARLTARDDLAPGGISDPYAAMPKRWGGPTVPLDPGVTKMLMEMMHGQGSYQPCCADNHTTKGPPAGPPDPTNDPGIPDPIRACYVPFSAGAVQTFRFVEKWGNGWADPGLGGDGSIHPDTDRAIVVLVSSSADPVLVVSGATPQLLRAYDSSSPANFGGDGHTWWRFYYLIPTADLIDFAGTTGVTRDVTFFRASAVLPGTGVGGIEMQFTSELTYTGSHFGEAIETASASTSAKYGDVVWMYVNSVYRSIDSITFTKEFNAPEVPFNHDFVRVNSEFVTFTPGGGDGSATDWNLSDARNDAFAAHSYTCRFTGDAVASDFPGACRILVLAASFRLTALCEQHLID
jgi:hypothetical protein